jgi:hypothetical protein
LVVHSSPAPDTIVNSAEFGHSVEPMTVVVVVPPGFVVVVPPGTVVVVPPGTVVVVPPGTVVVVPPGTVVVVPPGTVVVVPPGTVVVVTGGNVVVTVVLVEVVTVVDEVVVELGHGQSSTTFCPTAFFKHASASLAVVLDELLVSQIQAGSHVSAPVAERRMNKQSLAVGSAPLVTGWPQSPCAAKAAGAPARAPMTRSATAKDVMRR